MKKSFIIYNLSFIVCFLFIHSCGKHPEIPVKIGRMEQNLFSVPVDSITEYIPLWEQQYGELFDLYSNRIICIGSPKNPEYPLELTKFLTDEDMNIVYKRVMEVFPDLKEIESGLGKGFFNYGREFPDRTVPSVYSLMSGFNQTLIVTDTILAFSLDKYLGKNEEFYYMMEIPNYQRQTMDRKYLASDCIRAWVLAEFPFNDSIDNVLANILYEGKVMYAVQQLLPQTPDSLIFGFTPDQMRWCRNNTAQMWTFLVENRLLFSTEYLTISKLINPAPFCALFTRESPGRAVIWLGYRIIASYMKQNKVTLENLLLDNDYQQILAKTKFKP